MQTVSDLYKELLAENYSVETRLGIEGGKRLINEDGYYITFGGYRILVRDTSDPETAYKADSLRSMSCKQKLFAKNTPAVGGCITAQMDVEMNTPDIEIPKNAKLVPYVRLAAEGKTSEWIQKGIFYIDTRKESKDGSKIKRLVLRAYDAMRKAEQDYPATALSWPASDIAVVREICSYLGFELDERTTAIITKGYTVQLPVGYSCREVLGYIAAMYGGNFVMSDQGKLLLVQLGVDPAETVDLGRRMKSFSSSEALAGYDRVELVLNEDEAYYAGASEGRTMTVECPWGTQAMANALLAQFQNFRYQPFKAENTILDPAAELGDGVTANGVTGSICTMDLTFGSGFRGTVSAPWEEELDHEYPYVSKQDRKIRRQLHGLTTELTVQAGLIQGEITDRINEIDLLESKITQTASSISAKVSKTGGSSSSFGWDLTDSDWTLKANGRTVLKASASGVEITGKITATSGEIGGFTIENGYLCTKGQTWEGDEYYGIYIGPSGIQLGKSFKVSREGALEASSGTFTGTVYASSIAYDGYGEEGYFSGEGIEPYTITGWGGSDQIDWYTLATTNFVEGVNESLANADWAAGVLSGAESVEWLGAETIMTVDLDVSGTLWFGDKQLYLGSFPDKNGTIQRCVQWYD